jgi:zinc transport system permease protein
MSLLYESIRQFFARLAAAGILPQVFEYSFVVNSLLCAIAIGPILGGIGTMVVTKRMAFFSQAIGQASMTGVAIGIMLGESYTSPFISLFGFCILFGLFMNYTRNRTKMSPDTMIGVFLSISLAVGSALLLYVTTQVNIHILDNVLFGSILTVNDTDMNILLIIAVLCAALGIPYFNRMLLASFNKSLARVRGVKVKLLDYLFILMVTLITVASVKIIGAVLVEALLLIPAASARNICRSVRGFFFLSLIFSLTSCIVGVLLPVIYDIQVPSGSAIILCAAVIFFFSIIARVGAKRFRGAEV